MVEAAEAYPESHARGFVHQWPVAPEYRIVNGQVCPLGAEGQFLQEGAFHSFTGCRPYLPMAHRELPGALAKVATGHEADVLDFVKRYGVLGYTQAGSVEEWIGTRVREAEFEGAMGRQPEVDDAALHGDPLSWVMNHARTVQLALDLLGHLDDDAALRAFLATLKVQRNGQAVSYDYRYAERGYVIPKGARAVERNRSPREMALAIVGHLLNQNLTGVSRHLLVEWQPGPTRLGFSSMFAPRNLADAVYWHLADAAIGGWVRRCANPDCGAWFVATSRKVKFCPAPRGYYAADDEREPVSLCMNRHKQQVFRAHRRERAARAVAQRKKGRKQR